jgi:serine/threonine protein kinase
MSYTRIIEKVKELNSINNVEFNFARKLRSGGYTECSLAEIIGVTYSVTKEGAQPKPSEKLLVVYSMPKMKQSIKANIPNIIYAHKQLNAAHIPDEFNHGYLYFSDSGEMISEYANKNDLEIYIINNQKLLPLAALRRLMGQLILALDDYHSRHMVHRDIKPANVLVFFRNGQHFLKLADQDQAERLSEDGNDLAYDRKQYQTGTEDYIAPEVIKFNYDSSHFKRKPVDCYALGCTLRAMISMLKPAPTKQFNSTSVADLKQLADLIIGLTTVNPVLRITIGQAKENIFYGSTPEERKIFFNKIRADARYDFVINEKEHVKFSDIILNDASLLLNQEIKKIIQLGIGTAELITECTQQISFSNNSMDTVATTSSKIEVLSDSVDALKEAIHQLCINNSFYQKNNYSLAQLERVIDDEMRNFSSLFEQKLSSVFKVIITESVIEYNKQLNKKIDKLSMILFSHHETLYKTESSVLINKINNANNPKDVLLILYDFVSNNKFLSNDFKSILDTNFKKGFSKTIEQSQAEIEIDNPGDGRHRYSC